MKKVTVGMRVEDTGGPRITRWESEEHFRDKKKPKVRRRPKPTEEQVPAATDENNQPKMTRSNWEGFLDKSEPELY